MIAAAIGGDRRSVDDRSAFLQMRERGLRHVEIAENIRLEGSPQLFGRYLRYLCLLVLLGGIVDEHVEMSELLDAALDRGSAERGRRYVAFDQERSFALPLDQRLRL